MSDSIVRAPFPMPFQQKAKIVIENQNDVPYGQYFYVDYELYREPLPQPLDYTSPTTTP